MMKALRFLLLATLLASLLTACGIDAGPPREVDAVPSGDPPFPQFTGSWVIDTTGEVPQESVAQANQTLQKLRDDGIAETVILVMKGVKHPELYPTRFGRHIQLGSTETDNGVVYLIRPDAPLNERIVYSIGRGLPEFTSGRVTDAVEVASVKANDGDFAGAVTGLAQGTDEVLRKLIKPQPETATEEGEQEMTPEQKKTLVVTVIVIAAVWFVIGLLLMIIDVELGFWWWYLGLRIFIIALSGGKAGTKTGGSGKFGGRVGTR